MSGEKIGRRPIFFPFTRARGERSAAEGRAERSGAYGPERSEAGARARSDEVHHSQLTSFVTIFRKSILKFEKRYNTGQSYYCDQCYFLLTLAAKGVSPSQCLFNNSSTVCKLYKGSVPIYQQIVQLPEVDACKTTLTNRTSVTKVFKKLQK